MSTFRKIKKRCAVCGNEAEYNVIMSSNSMGCMDLDTRPPQMIRSLISMQIEYCEKCGYANSSISSKVSYDTRKLMRTEEYEEIVNNESINKTSKAYLLSGYLNSKEQNYKDSGFLYLKAAWTFDDCRDLDNSIIARKKAIKEFENYLKNNEDVQLEMIIVDALRRSKQFDKAIVLSNELIDKVDNEFLKQIIKFQITLCNNQDYSCHDVGEV